MKSSRDYLGLSNSCSYNVDDVERTDLDFKISVALLITEVWCWSSRSAVLKF